MLTTSAYQQTVPVHTVTQKGVIKCPYDMFHRWKPGHGRRFPEFTERGDRFEKEDSNKMLLYLVRYFIKSYASWELAIIRDNRIPPNEPSHHLLKMVWKTDHYEIEVNRLADHPYLAQRLVLPDWLTNQQ